MTQTVDRRHFLQGLAVASSVAAAGSLRPAAAQDAQGQEAAGSAPEELKPVRVGVMGLSRGRDLALGFAQQSGVEVRYVCDVDSQRAEACAAQLVERGFPRPTPIGDFRRILEDPEVDALVCAAPNHWHGPATIFACQAGKHVYVEKPCSHNPQEGEWMIQVARAGGRVVQMGAQRRSSVGTIEAMKRLADGAIGRVYLARCWYSNARGPIGRGRQVPVPENLDFDLWQGPAPRRPYVDNLVHYNWHWRWHWGNGELGNNGVHAIDLCRWGLQVDFPIYVTSSGGRFVFDDDQETPDTHAVAFEFPGEKMITWEGMSCNRHEQRWVVFHGEEGTLDLEANGRFVIYDQRNQVVDRFEQSDGGQTRHLANFAAAVRANDPKLLNCEIEQGHKSTLLCHLGNIAQRVRRSLTCDPANGHILHDEQAMELWGREYDPSWKPEV